MTSCNIRKISWLAGLVAGLIILGGGGFRAEAGFAAGERSPELVFSTYLGGMSGETSVAIERGFMGRFHLTGLTRSEDFPSVNSHSDFNPFYPTEVFLATFDGKKLVYSSFLNFPGEVSPFDLTTYGPVLFFWARGAKSIPGQVSPGGLSVIAR